MLSAQEPEKIDEVPWGRKRGQLHPGKGACARANFDRTGGRACGATRLRHSPNVLDLSCRKRGELTQNWADLAERETPVQVQT